MQLIDCMLYLPQLVPISFYKHKAFAVLWPMESNFLAIIFLQEGTKQWHLETLIHMFHVTLVQYDIERKCIYIYIYKHKDFIYLLGKTERKIHVALLVKMEKKTPWEKEQWEVWSPMRKTSRQKLSSKRPFRTQLSMEGLYLESWWQETLTSLPVYSSTISW